MTLQKNNIKNISAYYNLKDNILDEVWDWEFTYKVNEDTKVKGLTLVDIEVYCEKYLMNIEYKWIGKLGFYSIIVKSMDINNIIEHVGYGDEFFMSDLCDTFNSIVEMITDDSS